ncbi:MAG: NADase-type glycan-binding domain-containing protein [Alkalispirochaeta sp.]
MNSGISRTVRIASIALFVMLTVCGGRSPSVFGRNTSSDGGEAQREAAASFSLLTLNSVDGRLFRASSTLEADSPYDLGTYGMQTLFDDDISTGWSEGVDGPGIGEVLWIDLPEGSDTLQIRNGFARTPRLFRMNNRVAELHLSLWEGVLPDGMVSETTAIYVMAPVTGSEVVHLDDTRELQEVTLPALPPEARPSPPEGYKAFAEAEGLPPNIHEIRRFLRLEIAAVYPGSRWDDTCLTEIGTYPDRSPRD